MNVKSLTTFSILIVMSHPTSANWSGSKVINDIDRVQVIGQNIYVNLSIPRDFSSLANIPISNAPMAAFDIDNVDLKHEGNCFYSIDMTEYDNATIANGGTVNKHDPERQKHALKLVEERNRKSKECRHKLAKSAKAEHHQSEIQRLKSETLDALTLRENELDQTKTHLYRVATTGKDDLVSYRTKDLCLENCTYSVTTTTVMFEFNGNAHIYSAQPARIQGNFMVIDKSLLENGNSPYHRHKVIPMSHVTE